MRHCIKYIRYILNGFNIINRCVLRINILSKSIVSK